MINLRRSIVLSFVGLLTPLSAVFGRTQDRASVVPEMKVLLENEQVRVQFHDVAVGEKTPMHSHPAYVAYVFSPYSARFILADGSLKTAERKTGDVFYSGPVTHSVENTGTTPIHNLIVELKENAAGNRKN